MLPVNGSEVLVIKDPELEAYNEKDSLLIGPGLDVYKRQEEASATCGFAYGILRGVHCGLLEEKWLRWRNGS